jgi:hypothetical protein
MLVPLGHPDYTLLRTDMNKYVVQCQQIAEIGSL